MPVSTDPIVSVVVPFRDPIPWMLQEAVDGVFGQTYSAWELLLVNDGGEGSPRRLLRRIVGRDPARIRLLQHPGAENRGAAASRNLGIREGSGRYVAFLDADDFWLPQKLAKQVSLMERHPEVALTYGTHLVWFSWSGAIEHAAMDRELPPSPLADRVAQPPEAVREFLNDRSIAGTSSLFVRREHALEVGGFEESLAWAEDQTLTYKIGLRRPIFISSELMHRYRKHPGATTTLLEAKGRRFTSQLLFLDWVGRLFKEEGVRDADLWVALYLRKAKYQRTVLRERSTRAFRNAARKVRRGLKSRGRRLRLSWIGLVAGGR